MGNKQYWEGLIKYGVPRIPYLHVLLLQSYYNLHGHSFPLPPSFITTYMLINRGKIYKPSKIRPREKEYRLISRPKINNISKTLANRRFMETPSVFQARRANGCRRWAWPPSLYRFVVHFPLNSLTSTKTSAMYFANLCLPIPR